MSKYFYTLFFVVCSFHVFAGSIKGTIIDSKNNLPLTGVVVSLTGTAKGAVTDIDGKYELTDLANGSYELVFSYPSYKIYKQDITISGGEDVVVDMKLMPEQTELQGHVIKSSRITNTENSVISEIKSSNAVVSGTSAAQISKSNDRNAADVVKRIPGVTIQDDRFIIVRGLPDRYNTVWLNDASTPSSESDKKAFSFDIIPAGLIDRVLIYKTPSAELPGDFAGGMVKVYTTSVADKNQVSVSFQTSSREGSTGTDLNFNKRSSTDWLGYDDGDRNIPSIIPAAISSKDPNYKANIKAWSQSFGNDWIIYNEKTKPDIRFNLALSNVVKFKKIKIGNTFGVTYSNTYTNYQIHRQGWDSVSKNYNFNDRKSANNINASVMDNLGVVIGNSKIEFKNLYNQTGSATVTARRTIQDTTITSQVDEKSYAMGYESRATYAGELTGTHKNKKDTRRYTWALGYTDLFKNQPDLRRIRYTKDFALPDSMFSASIPNQVDILNGGRYYATLYEKTYSFNHQFTQNIRINDHFDFDVNAGNYIEFKSRSYKIRQLGYMIKSGANALRLRRLDVNEIFADSNVDGTNKFKIGETTNPYDHYSGENKLIASFLSVKVPVGRHITIVGGARYEINEQSINAVVNLDTVTPDIKTKFLLPSVNAVYNFTEKSLVRVAYGKTLNRPEFREWAPIYYYDFDELSGNYGSLFPTSVTRNKSGIGDTLKVAEVQNYDLRYELYPSAGELIQVGVFYKSFKNPIQRVVLTSGGSDSKAFTYINADKANCYGVEIDLRKNLRWLDEKIGTNVFKDLAFVCNLALTKSELTIDTARVSGAIPRSSLQGQSPYIVNAGLYYQSQQLGLQGSVLYNVFGARMYAVGTTEAGAESIGEMPFKSFDIALSKTFFKHYIINFGVQNLLNSKVLFMEDVNRDNKFTLKDDKETKGYYPGRYYSIGVKIKF